MTLNHDMRGGRPVNPTGLSTYLHTYKICEADIHITPESRQGVPEETDQLRCPSSLLPPHHPEHRPPGEEEPQHPAPEWYAIEPSSPKYHGLIISSL